VTAEVLQCGSTCWRTVVVVAGCFGEGVREAGPIGTSVAGPMGRMSC
jgi:hypothetical protein